MTWTKINLSPLSDLLLVSVSSSASRWLIAGTQSLYYSDDGVVWTKVEFASWTPFSDIAHNGSVFMAVGSDEVRTSSDGLIWTRVHRQISGRLNSVAWTGSEWAIGGTDNLSVLFQKGIVLRSANGTNFSLETRADIGEFLEIGGKNGEILALAIDGKASHFSEGTWADGESGLTGEPVFLRPDENGVTGFTNSGMTGNFDDAGVWSLGSQRVAHGDFQAVITAGGSIVIGTDGRSFRQGGTLTSTDGENWTDSTPTEISVGSIGPVVEGLWTGSEFVMLATNGSYFSADGLVWTEALTGMQDEFSVGFFNGRVIYGGSGSQTAPRMSWRQPGGEIEGTYQGLGAVFAIVSDGSEVLALGSSRNLVSADGNLWQALNDVEGISDDSNDLLDVIYTPVGFVAVGLGGKVMLSSDGYSWQGVETGAGQLNAVSYGAGKLVAVGNSITTSLDGEAWSPVEAELPAEGYVDVVSSGERFVAVGDEVAAYSTDGLTWVTVEVPEDLVAVAWNDMQFMAAGSSGASYFSDDGLSWELKVLPRDILSHASGNGMTIVATRRGSFYRTTDGENWELAYDPGSQSRSNPARVTFANGLFFVQYQPSSLSNCIVSADGINWSFLPPRVWTVTWTGTRFIALADSFRVYTSADGLTWDLEATASQSSSPRAAVWTGSELISVGTRGAAYSLSADLTWTALTSGTNEDLVEVIWTGSQAVALDESGDLVYFGAGPALPEGLAGRGLLMSGGKLVVACDEGLVAFSDGVTWTVVDTGAVADLKTITEEGGTLLATGEWSTFVRSQTLDPAGLWDLEVRSGRQDRSYRGLSAKEGQFHAFSSSGRFVSSQNGLVWDVRGDSFAARSYAVEIGEPEEFISFGAGGDISRIEIGDLVVQEVSGTSSDLRAAARSENTMVAVGNGGVIVTSKAGDDQPSDYRFYIAKAGGIADGAKADSDWDLDGVSNFMEYLFGLNSKLGSPPDSIHELFAISNTHGEADLNFEVFTDLVDAEIRVLRSADLNSWEEVASKIGTGYWHGPVLITESPGAEGKTKVSVLDPLALGARFFYRLEVQPR